MVGSGLRTFPWPTKKFRHSSFGFPGFDDEDAGSHPDANYGGEEADGSKAAVGLREEDDQDEVECVGPGPFLFKSHEQPSEGFDRGVGKAEESSRRNMVVPKPSARWESFGGSADGGGKHRAQHVFSDVERRLRIEGGLLPKERPLLGFMFNRRLIGQRDGRVVGRLLYERGRLVEHRVVKCVVLIVGVGFVLLWSIGNFVLLTLLAYWAGVPARWLFKKPVSSTGGRGLAGIAKFGLGTDGDLPFAGSDRGDFVFRIGGALGGEPGEGHNPAGGFAQHGVGESVGPVKRLLFQRGAQ